MMMRINRNGVIKIDGNQLITNLAIIIVTFIFAAFFVATEFALVQARVTALLSRHLLSFRLAIELLSKWNCSSVRDETCCRG